MNGFALLGVALLVVSGIHLVPALLWGWIPANWPVHPLTRAGKPEQFWATFTVFAIAALVGAALLVAGLLTYARF